MIVLSFSDFLKAIRRHKKAILCAGALLGLICFVHQVTRVPTYKAEATFKGASRASINGLSNTMQMLMHTQDETHDPSYDGKTFLCSTPVAEKAIEQLHLQGELRPLRRKNLFARLGKALGAELLFYRHRFFRSSHSELLHKSFPVPRKPLGLHKSPSLYLTSLHYRGDLAAKVDLRFTSDRDFVVRRGKRVLGNGELGVPFVDEHVVFTLERAPLARLKKKRYMLCLTPLRPLVQSLQKRVEIKRDQENLGLLHLSFRHRDPVAAASLLNAIMHQFQDYLKREGQQKVIQQLAYLERRKVQTMEGFDQVMEGYQSYLKEHLGTSGFFALNQEIQRISDKRLKAKSERSKFKSQISSIQKDWESDLPFDEFVTPYLEETSSLNLDKANQQLAERKEKRAAAQTKQSHYAFCIEQLEDPQFTSLRSLVTEPSLVPHVQTLHELQHKIFDEGNWTQKELVQLKEARRTELAFVKEELTALLGGAKVCEEEENSEIRLLQEKLMAKLASKYQNAQEDVEEMSEKLDAFPQQWAEEQKIELDRQIHQQMMQSITQLIEARNVNQSFDYLNTAAVTRALPPPFPSAPRPLLFLVIGAFAGVSLAMLVLFALEVYRGPNASLENLVQLGYPVANGAQQILVHLHGKSGLLYFCSPDKTPLCDEVCALLKASGQTVEKISFQKSFRAQGTDWRVLEGDDPSWAVLATQTVQIISQQRLSELVGKEAIYVVQPTETHKFELHQLRGKIEKLLTSFSKSSSKQPSSKS